MIDLPAAVSWWGRAAEQGHLCAIGALGDYKLTSNGNGTARSQRRDDFSLGVCYEHARDVAKDARAAAKHFSRAAEDGHVGAMEALADCFGRGYGVELNVEEAAKWRILADEANDGDDDGDEEADEDEGEP